MLWLSRRTLCLPLAGTELAQIDRSAVVVGCAAQEHLAAHGAIGNGAFEAIGDGAAFVARLELMCTPMPESLPITSPSNCSDFWLPLSRLPCCCRRSRCVRSPCRNCTRTSQLPERSACG